MKYKFIKGLKLSEGFYNDIVKPLIIKFGSNLKYSAALLGYGSDVLGFDTDISMDHNWGPRLVIFLNEENFQQNSNNLDNYLKWNLPFEYNGFPTNFSDPRVDHTQAMKSVDNYPIRHLIQITTIREFTKGYLGFDINEKLTLIDWLTFPEQGLIELTKGKVFYDGLNELNLIREKFQFFPKDILLIKLASLWQGISEEEAFVGRCIDLNDLIGMKLVVSRIIDLLMKICFYINKEYIPYSKWFGTSFNQLNVDKNIKNKIFSLLNESDPVKIVQKLNKIYEEVLLLQNKSGLVKAINKKIQDYYERPYDVIMASEIVENITTDIEEEKINNIDIQKIGLDVKISNIDFTDYKHILKKLIFDKEE